MDNIFDKILSFLENGLQIFTIICGVLGLYKSITLILEIAQLRRRLKAAAELHGKLDVISVEAEILDISLREWSALDKLYYIRVSYSVGERFFYKKLILHNRGSVRVGMKMILLCDSDEPDNAVVQDGSEERTLKKMIELFVFYIIFTIADFALNFVDFEKLF